jgi:hypothetical protein
LIFFCHWWSFKVAGMINGAFLTKACFLLLKIASWEFCARRHEELIPRRSIIPQVSQLGAVVQKYQSAVQNSTNLSTQDMQNNCNS